MLFWSPSADGPSLFLAGLSLSAELNVKMRLFESMLLVPVAWSPISMRCASRREAVTHSQELHHLLHATFTLLFFNFYHSVSACVFIPHGDFLQGERWVWPCRGESAAHRPACCSRYLLWELQDNPGLEICKCPWQIWRAAHKVHPRLEDDKLGCCYYSSPWWYLHPNYVLVSGSALWFSCGMN